jgi:hypothetical protein
MRCEECGADVPREETCLNRFHALLAAEVENDELRQMHGLTVLTYYLQHPSLTKPWFQVTGAETMRRIFSGGEDWRSVLMEAHPRGVGRRRSAAAVARMKAASNGIMPDWVIAHPIPDELTVVSIDPTATTGQADAILDWARSVAQRRFLHRR